jgi:hypothetical protein
VAVRAAPLRRRVVVAAGRARAVPVERGEPLAGAPISLLGDGDVGEGAGRRAAIRLMLGEQLGER